MAAVTSESIGRALVVGLAGPLLSARERAWIERYQPAGIILFARNVTGREPLISLIASLRECLEPGAEIVADHEGGPVSVLEGAIGRPPAPWAMGVVDDLELTRRVHAETGVRLRDLGIDRVLGPCCDVASATRNRIIGSRAFGAEAELVARHAAAAVLGLRESGVKCCLKHWPGHGGTVADTHLSAVTEAGPSWQEPFVAAGDAGADAIMMGHLPFADGGPPASLDAGLLADWHRDQPQMQLWSDDLTMAGVRPTLVRRTGDDPGGAGMINPEVIPYSWLETAAVSGCERLLLRGVPWQALPVSSTSAVSGEGPVPGLKPDVLPPAVAWEDVRRRCSANVTTRGRLVWLEGSPGHRWGSLSLADIQHSGWHGVVETIDQDVSHLPPDLLLVTSQDPLSGDMMQQLLAWKSLWPQPHRAPRIFVMGHPSLAADVSNCICPSEICFQCFDVTAHELSVRLAG